MREQARPTSVDHSSKVFRELLFGELDLGPASAPWLLGIERLGAPDYPPSTHDMRKGVRVVRCIQSLDPVRGRRRAIAGTREGCRNGVRSVGDKGAASWAGIDEGFDVAGEGGAITA
jgi:hypothetical protein